MLVTLKSKNNTCMGDDGGGEVIHEFISGVIIPKI